MALRKAVIRVFSKKSENGTDKVKIRKPASECTKEVHDRAGYLHILALDVLLYEFLYQYIIQQLLTISSQVRIFHQTKL